MEVFHDGFLISDDPGLIQPDRVCAMLATAYWSKHRTKETICKSLQNSLCFGVYLDGRQIGLARCITDYAVLYYLADVVIEEPYRGRGLGKALMKAITEEHEVMSTLIGFLDTKDMQPLYSQYGFWANNSSMRKNPPELQTNFWITGPASTGEEASS